MVFCCFDSSAWGPEYDSNRDNANSRTSHYPGQRRMVKTAGNALAAAPPPQLSPAGSDMVSVIVPHGVGPGNTLMVKSPDGTRTAHAVVPDGISPGQSFIVHFPAGRPGVNPAVDTTPAFANSLNTYIQSPVVATPVPSATASAPPPPSAPVAPTTVTAPIVSAVNPEGKYAGDVVESRQEDVPPRAESVNHILSPDPPPTRPATTFHPPTADPPTTHAVPVVPVQPPAAASPIVTAVPSIPPPTAAAVVPEQPQQQQQQPEQKLLLVNVPPGTRPGTVIHVEVPGENRTLAATVPEGVSSFHVAYTPHQPQYATSVPEEELLPPPTVNRTTRQQQQQQQQQPYGGVTPLSMLDSNYYHETAMTSPVGQKLLLVQVPPGTRVGTTLHVSVPDEPGRLIAAKVPAGNIREFHVAYEPRTAEVALQQPQPQQNRRAYGQQQSSSWNNQQPYGYQQPQSSYGSNNGYNHNRPYNNNNGSGAADYIMPALGAAAVGAAAFATYNHFHHQEQDTGYANYDNADDVGGDDDLGGDYGDYDDDGGGDMGDY